MKEKKGVKFDVELTADDLKSWLNQFKAEYKKKMGADFPDDPKEQLMGLSRLYSVPGTTRVQTYTVVTTISRILGYRSKRTCHGIR